MMKIFKFLFLCFSTLLLLSASSNGCKNRVSDSVARPATESRTVNFLQKKLEANALHDVERMSARMKIAFEQDGSTLQGSGNLIWVKDSMLWMNFKKFGLEGARVLITPDSAVILNRLEKTVLVKTWDELRREYQMPEGFPLLENLILAKAWFASGMVLASDLKDGLHRLSGTTSRFSADYRIEEGRFTVKQMTFLEQKEARAATFGFDRFEKLPGYGQLPYLRTIETFSPESGTSRVEIELSDVEINKEKHWRFEIPDHYRRVE